MIQTLFCFERSCMTLKIKFIIIIIIIRISLNHDEVIKLLV